MAPLLRGSGRRTIAASALIDQPTMPAWNWALYLLGSAALAWAAVSGYGRWRWKRSTRTLHERLEAELVMPAPTRFESRELAGLPPVVQTYLRTVLCPGTPLVVAARLEHRGEFNLGETSDRWVPFTSRQYVVTRRPGFLWDARMRVVPGLPVRVHDAYIAGHGLLHPALLGLFELGRMPDDARLAHGELMRFLAEAAWYPTALLPSQGVRWEPVDATCATAHLCDADVEVRLHFQFGSDGLIDSVRADARARTVGRDIVWRAWEGRWSDYQLHDGICVPMAGEVAWLLPRQEGGRKPYWRGRLERIEYRFAA